MDVTVGLLCKWMLLWDIWVNGCCFRISGILSLVIYVTRKVK